MDAAETPEIIKVTPKTEMLSAEQLTQLRNVAIRPLVVGLKRTHVSDDPKEAKLLSRLHANLKKQISVPRIERLAGRALGVWDAEERAVRVTRKDGKFESFGYNRKGKLYLEYFEALFLLELGRLQLEYNNQTASVEQAYLLLLGEERSPKFNEYLVYSNFMRVGYILVSYQAVTRSVLIESKPNECIWAWLRDVAGKKRYPIPDHVLQSTCFNQCKRSMEAIKLRIQKSVGLEEQTSEELPPGLNFVRKIQTKGKQKSAMNYQKPKPVRPVSTRPVPPRKSWINFLKNEPEYHKFCKRFQKFDIIELQANINTSTVRRQLQINFDVHLHNAGFKKSSPTEPVFRLIILGGNESFPTYAEIANCYNQQNLKVPLLVASVSESKQIQAFIYFFV